MVAQCAAQNQVKPHLQHLNLPSSCAINTPQANRAATDTPAPARLGKTPIHAGCMIADAFAEMMTVCFEIVVYIQKGRFYPGVT